MRSPLFALGFGFERYGVFILGEVVRGFGVALDPEHIGDGSKPLKK